MACPAVIVCAAHRSVAKSRSCSNPTTYLTTLSILRNQSVSLSSLLLAAVRAMLWFMARVGCCGGQWRMTSGQNE